MKKFIEDNHQSTNKVLFWPDRASAHYASSNTTWLESEGVVFVPQHDNPPNCPQVRPIDRFWAILKMKVYERGWTVSNKTDLAKRIKTCAKKTTRQRVPKLVQEFSLKNSKNCQ